MAITTMELKRAMIEQQRTILELRARLTKTEKEHVQKDNIIQRLLRRETEVILRGQEWRFRAETAEARLAEVEAQRDVYKEATLGFRDGLRLIHSGDHEDKPHSVAGHVLRVQGEALAKLEEK